MNKDPQCYHCAHRDVCSFKEIFIKAHAAIGNFSFNGATNPKKGEVSIVRICDLHWIAPVELKCKYFMERRETFERR